MREEIIKSMDDAFAIFDAIGGNFFGVTFVKSDGSVRKMTARQHVRKHVKGGTLAYDPAAKGLLSVWEPGKGYRMVNVRNLLEIRFCRTKYRRTY